jgi:hypothetical protein
MASHNTPKIEYFSSLDLKLYSVICELSSATANLYGRECLSINAKDHEISDKNSYISNILQ